MSTSPTPPVTAAEIRRLEAAIEKIAQRGKREADDADRRGDHAAADQIWGRTVDRAARLEAQINSLRKRR